MSDSATQPARSVFTANVLANEAVCEEHFRLTVSAADFPPTQPGQFVQVLCRPGEEPASGTVIEWPEGQTPALTQRELVARQPMLRRPFSIGGRQEVGGVSELDIIYCVKGAGTEWLQTLTADQTISLLGPLGNSFSISPEKSVAALIGGGVGVPPMLYLAEALQAAGKQTTAFIGARSGNRIPGKVSADGSVDEFGAFGAQTIIATDDGSLGHHGMVGEAFSNWLEASGVDPAQVVVYSCGPEPMMQSVAFIALAAGCECELSLERYMACGMGTCQSCVCKLRDTSDQGWAYKLCCTDGPVFAASDIIWSD
jgi:dihydroorotate dehydrogenase electron transfer subunit